jgi:hypothetical protein
LVVPSRIGLCFALVAVTWLSLVPYSIPSPAPDKVSHLAASFALCWLADFSFPRRPWVLKIAPLFFYGWGLELLQRAIPGRVSEAWDVVANAGGLLLYALLASGAGYAMRRKTRELR